MDNSMEKIVGLVGYSFVPPIEGYDIPFPWLAGSLHTTVVVHSRMIPGLVPFEQLLTDMHPSVPLQLQSSLPSAAVSFDGEVLPCLYFLFEVSKTLFACMSVHALC